MLFMEKLVIFVLLLGVARGTVEDDVYIESLAANIEKSGLLKNFGESWRNHLDTWHFFHGRERNDTDGTTQTPVSFNCNTTITGGDLVHTVHRLQPGHIGIIGAMGASMVAGVGADATRLLETTLQYRGLSFAIGGDGNLNTTATLPNILKRYNSKLMGSSRSIAPSWFEELARLNVAVPGAMAKDLDDQAKELVKRVNKIPMVNDYWKVISIFIGMNDLCESCDQRVRGRASTYGHRIKDALDRLSKEMTKTVVNLIALPPMHQWYRQLHDDPVCIALHRYLCPCILNPKADADAFEYNAELYKLAKDFTFNKIDFTVLVQPFMSGRAEFPKTNVNGQQKTDQSFFAPDCFHLSRKGHAAAATALWANMFQPVTDKSTNFDFSKREVTCPDQNCPYFRTFGNSGRCSQSGEIRPPTLLPSLENVTFPSLENVTVPPQFNSSVIYNNTRLHHLPSNWNLTHWNISQLWNYTQHRWNISAEKAENITEYLKNHTLKPWTWPRMMQVANENRQTVAGAGWVAFGIVLALAVVAVAVIGYVDLKKRQRQTNGGERTPLLTGSNVDKIY